MDTKIKLSIISLAALAALSGCGSSNTATDTTTGIAYYLDSAVEGITYQCGAQMGITDSKGAFTFEKGKNCTFYVGDIQVKNISATDLSDGKKFIENNATTAAFLQTLDVDGNATNGIQIDNEIITTLKQNNTKEVPKTQTQRTDVWSALKQNNAYKGRLIDEDNAMAHVEQTKKKYIKNTNNTNKHGIDKNKTVRAFFGDKENNQIDVVDVDNMQLIDTIPTGHQKTYAAEVIKFHGQETQTPKMYIDNRGSDAIDVLDSATNEIVKTINLPFHPRSISVNKDTGLVAVSGVDKPMTAIIDAKTDTLIATVGENNVTYPVTSGHSYVSSGTLACGHPEWLDNNHFVLLDRQNKEIKTYKIFKDANGAWQTTLVNTLQTPSPIHNLIPPKIHGKVGKKIAMASHSFEKGNHENQQYKESQSNQSTNKKHAGTEQYSTIFYATAEGATDVYPSVLKLEFNENTGLKIVDNLEIKKEGISANVMGVLHLIFMKDHKHIYVGSNEGGLFIVNYATSPMRIEKIVAAGKGAGHTDEFKHGNIAVVINHKDKFITLMNTATNTKIANIDVSQIDDSLVGKVQTQSHPQYHFSEDGKYFYMFLTEEGALVKVNLITKELEQRLDIGGKIAMGSFIGH